jgi:hypothetical protein
VRLQGRGRNGRLSTQRLGARVRYPRRIRPGPLRRSYTRFEWCWIVLAIVSVWTAETLNTAFEFLTDVASPEFHPLAGKAKDVAAGAVLLSAIGAVAIGIIIFWPHLLALS